MKRTLMLASALCTIAIATPPPAAAQDPRLSERDCSIVADMALVARSLAVEKVGRDLAARIMAQVYVAQSGSEAAVQIRERVLATAYGRSEPPMDFARMVGTACLRTGGDQGAMFGTGVRWRPAPRVPHAARGLRV